MGDFKVFPVPFLLADRSCLLSDYRAEGFLDPSYPLNRQTNCALAVCQLFVNKFP